MTEQSKIPLPGESNKGKSLFERAEGAFGLTQLKSTFSTAGALERALDLPVLGTISETLSERARALRAKRMKLFYAASGSLAGLFVLLLGIEFVQRGMVA